MTIQRAITLINMSLLTLIAYFGVGLFYQAIGIQVRSWRELPAMDSAVAPQVKRNEHPLPYYQPILDRDLFKTKSIGQTQAAAKSVDLEALEETKLKLKLWGTVSGSPETAYAVIEDTQKKEQDLYRVGDSIQEAALKLILRGKVVLSVNGKDEILAMEETGQATPSASAARTARPAEPISSDPARAQRISLNRGMIEEAMQDVTKLMTDIAITPHMEDGQAAGLAINNIKPNSIFRRMGLRNGDILVGVDGQEIRSVDDALRLYDSLKSSSGVKVQIKRRGQERTIDYNIR